jgi:serine-type D-Ala-D-Ala carboxypeptidase/endopeptidase (penicillin-binding protein 4)
MQTSRQTPFTPLSLLFLCGCLTALPAGRAEEARTQPGDAAVRSVPPEISRAMREAGMKPGQLGLLAVDAETRQVLAAVAPDQPMIPASTIKLVTTACALERLGPAHRFETRFLAAARPAPGGLLAADLWIVGGGNPLLRSEDLWVALRELHAVGVRTIAGDVVLDDSLFEPPGYPAGWPRRRVPDPYDAPQGALALAWNSLEVIVRPGAAVGAPAQVETFPLRDVATLVNRVRTDRRTAVRVDRLAERAGEPGGILLRGTIAVGGKPDRTWVHLDDPTAVAAAAVGELLADVGIALAGEVRTGSGRDDLLELVVHRSPPLSQLVAAVNKWSSNFGAEMLTRGLAATAGGPPGTTSAGVAELRACLAEWKVSDLGAQLVDGSGYSRSNRLTARTLTDLILAAGNHPQWEAEWIASWPRAGEDGSLKSRLRSHTGRLRAKTGTLNGVSTLAGRAIAPDGHPIAFAILVNGRPQGAPVGPWLADRLADALMRAIERLASAERPDQKGRPIEN